MNEILEGPVDSSATEARFDPKKLERLTDHYRRLCGSGRILGASFLLAREGRVFACRAMGRRSFESETDPLRPQTIKRIASITKVITAAAVMRLVEEGALWLEQPVKAIIKEFDTPLHGGISLWHLLTHTSGLPADPGYWSEPYPMEERWELLDEPDWLVKGVLTGPLQHRPGEQWNYCSLGFAVLAEAVSRASGMHFNDYVEKNIFQALGMKRSFMEVPGKLWGEMAFELESAKQFVASAAQRRGAPRGLGGAASTLYDLFRFAQTFLNGGEYEGNRILGRKTVEEMTRNQLSGVPSYHWGKNCKEYRQGLGWGFYCDGSIVGPATYNHEGWGWCSLFVDPVEKFIFAAFVVDPADWDPAVMVIPRTIAFSGLW